MRGSAPFAPQAWTPRPFRSRLWSLEPPPLVLKTLVAVGVPRGLGRLPTSAGTRRRGFQAWGPPRGEVPRGDAPVPTPPRSWVLKPGPVSAGHPPIGLGALRKSRPGYAPPSAAPGRVVEGRLLWAVGPGRWPGAVARSGNYFFLREAAGHWARRAVLRPGTRR